VNAAERYWRALRRHDWHAAAAQFHSTATIERVGTTQRLTPEQSLAAMRDWGAGAPEVEVVTLVSTGERVAVRARLSGERGTRHCAGFYDLHDGRIAAAAELWVPDPP
jgi:SnoaL-like domain